MRSIFISYLTLVSLVGEVTAFEISPPTVISEVSGIANAPLVVVNDRGDTIALWQQLDKMGETLKVSTCTGDTPWTEALTLRYTTQKIDQVNLAISSEGEPLIMWVERRGAEGTLYSVTRQEGAWAEPISIAKDTGIRSLNLSLNQQGDAVAVWQRGSGGKTTLESTYTHVGEAWAPLSELTKEGHVAKAPTCSINDSGQIRVAWEEEKSIVTISSFIGQAWSQPKVISNIAESSVRPHIYLNNHGEAIAFWEREQGYKSTLQATYLIPGEEWSTPVDLSGLEESVSEPCGAINAHGDALIAWRSSSAQGATICVATTTATGEWTKPLTLSHRSKVATTPHVALNDHEMAVVAWRTNETEGALLEGSTQSPGKEWTLPMPLISAPARVTQASLTLNNQGVGVLLWRQKEADTSVIHSEHLSFKEAATPVVLAAVTSTPIPPPSVQEQHEQLQETSITPEEKREEEELAEPVEKSEGKGCTLPPAALEQLEQAQDTPAACEEKRQEEELAEPAPKSEEKGGVLPPDEISMATEESAESLPPVEEKSQPEQTVPTSDEPSVAPEESAQPLPPVEEKSQPEQTVPAPEEPAMVPERVAEPLPVEEACACSPCLESPEYSPCFESPACLPCCEFTPWLFEVRGAAYFPTASLMRRAFENTYAIGGLLLGYTFCDWLTLVGTASYTRQTGSDSSERKNPSMELIPVSVLLRLTYFECQNFNLYFGFGPRYFYLKTKNSLNIENKTATSEGIGAVAELGVLFDLSSCISLDLFLNYSYGTVSGTALKARRVHHTVNVGGLEAGLGLAFRF